MIPAPATVHADVAETTGNAEPAEGLRRQAVRHYAAVSSLLLALSIVVHVQLNGLPLTVPTASMILMGLGPWTVILILVWRGLAWHPHQKFGAANTVTLYRSAGTVLIASLVPVAGLLPVQWLWLVTALAILLLSLDGIDGYLARRTRLVSTFGARFDMEIDALLILTISVFLWQSGEIGLWIISLGLMRYGFVVASLWCRPLRADLLPSFRRKLVCVIQLVALCAILSPLISPPLSSVVGVIALICLSGSFARDIQWLYGHQSPDGTIAAHKAPGTVATIEASP